MNLEHPSIQILQQRKNPERPPRRGVRLFHSHNCFCEMHPIQIKILTRTRIRGTVGLWKYVGSPEFPLPQYVAVKTTNLTVDATNPGSAYFGIKYWSK